jgi:EAL domain-containing protein (putative c-di-GMP-specific phosphodiesterase class I)
VRTILDVTGLDPARLVLEIGEDRLDGLDLDMLLRLSALRDLGVGLSLDAFGATGADLSLLSILPLTSVKLHGTLLHRLPHDPGPIQSVVRAAHTMGLRVIATGVETEEQCLLLADIGCDAGQGDLFSSMISADQVQRLIG